MPSWTALAPRSNAAAIPRPSAIPPAAITGTADRIGNLRHQREQRQRLGRVAAKEPPGMAAGLAALRDHRIDPALLEPACFGDASSRSPARPPRRP